MALSKGAQNLHRYLESVREKIGAGGTVCCVVGNEAADLDSMASAVMYACYRQQQSDGKSEPAYVALINIPREDYKLRTEAVYLFESVGVKPEQLLFAGDVDLDRLHAAGKLQLILIDHNKPAAGQQQLSDCVTGVIDHHKDEGLFPDVSPRTIEPVGSAATLVAEAILNDGAALLEEGTARLLLGTILLDTVNLDPEAKRATEKDHRIVEKLLELTGADRQDLFDTLQREKFNVSALDSADLLRKDYKEWGLGGTQVGISSVLLPIADWLKKDTALSASLQRYAAERKLDVLVAMNAYTDPQFTRQLVVYCPDGALRKKLLDFLTGSELELTPISSDSINRASVDEATALFAQGNLAYSRKKLQPLLDGFFSGVA